MEIRQYRYANGPLMKDYLAAVTGLTVFGAPALFVPLSSVMVALFGGLGLYSAMFGVRTVLRQMSHVEAGEPGVRVVGPIGREIAWDDLRGVRLKFYSTWRDRKSGWMQLSLKGSGTAIRVDQGLDGFEDLARMAFARAESRGIGFDAATRHNAGALGLDLSMEAGSPD